MNGLVHGLRSFLLAAYGLPCREAPLHPVFRRRITAASAQLLSHPSTCDAKEYSNIAGLELAENYQFQWEAVASVCSPLPSLAAWKERQNLLNGYWQSHIKESRV